MLVLEEVVEIWPEFARVVHPHVQKIFLTVMEMKKGRKFERLKNRESSKEEKGLAVLRVRPKNKCVCLITYVMQSKILSSFLEEEEEEEKEEEERRRVSGRAKTVKGESESCFRAWVREMSSGARKGVCVCVCGGGVVRAAPACPAPPSFPAPVPGRSPRARVYLRERLVFIGHLLQVGCQSFSCGHIRLSWDFRYDVGAHGL